MWLFFAISSLCCLSSSDIDLYENNDTIVMLESVEIQSEKHELFSGSNRKQNIDNIILKQNYHSDLATLLSSHTPVSIKSYGPGILSTTSLRGGSASHTAFIWNGFNLQSPMHAQNDLSLVPVTFTDKMQIQYGGGSAIWGTGAVGGAIIMDNQPDFSPGQKIGFNSSASTIKDFHNSINAKWSNGVFATSLRLFSHNSKNQYQYVNSRLPDNPVEKQEHAEHDGWGILQETYYKPSNNHLFAVRAWMQQYDRKIPPTLFQEGAQAHQNDNFLRITANWQGLFDNLRFDLKTGYFEDYIHYNDDLFIDSKSRSKMQTSEAELRYYVFERNTINVGFNHQYLFADVDEYQAEPSENRYTLLVNWRWEIKPEKIITSINLRQKFAKEYDVEPAPSVGITYRPHNKIAVNTNISKNYRLPTLNDRYWSPGGNPDLKPESGWTQDLNLEFSDILILKSDNSLTKALSLKDFSIAFYHRKMNNWISWVPVDGGFWTPQNVIEVRSYGTEARKNISYSFDNFKINTTMFYSWTKSIYEKTARENDASIGKQLIYTPEQNAGINIALSLNSFSVSYNHRYTGKRYTTADNSRWLDPYNLADFRIDYEFKALSTQATAFFKAHNLWNQQYEVMQARPMPLRYFQIGLSIKYNN